MSPVYPGVTQLVGGKLRADSGLQENIQESPLPVIGRVDSTSVWEEEKAKGTAFCWIRKPGSCHGSQDSAGAGDLLTSFQENCGPCFSVLLCVSLPRSQASPVCIWGACPGSHEQRKGAPGLTDRQTQKGSPAA